MQGDANHWIVGRLAYQIVNKRSRAKVLELADAIGRGEDTVNNLAFAYGLFAEFVRDAWKKGETSEPIRKLRRDFPYTRWAVIFCKRHAHEFELDEARDWLENFSGGNDALGNEIENKHGYPEWERRANILYRQAYKLQTDFGVPDGLQKAAVNYVKEFETWEKAIK